ncbi:MAG: hypothetical protein KDB00_00420 [Planctomycetales bacterium]|nr:hypothetical protein [Planctomycetales bacterium]
MPDDDSPQPTSGIFRRIFRTIGICTAVSISLLCFPHWLPWMVAFWIAWHSVLVLRGRPGYWPLTACLTILVVRLAPATPATILLGVVLLGLAVWRFRSRANPLRFKRLGWGLLVAVWMAWTFHFVEYRRSASCNHLVTLDTSRPIVCIGDSLTEGMIPDRGYPGQLELMLTVPVINEGVSGIATEPAIGILERAIEIHHPQAVVLELGGHDFLKWHSRAVTKANLVKMIVLCRKHDCEPLLMEIPRGFMIDPYASLERELAYEYDLQLVDDRWLRHIVLMGPAAPPGMWFKSAQLSDDGIHSNPNGSRAIAHFVADALGQVFGDQVLR